MAEADLLQNCSLGIFMNAEKDCHKINKDVSSRGLRMVSELSSENIQLLRWRTNLQQEDLITICHHHENIFLTNFENFQWKCCDPYKLHNKVTRRSLRPISNSCAMQLNQLGILVKPGEKLCPTCRKRCADSDSQSDDDFIPSEVERAAIDTSLTELGCSPLKMHGIRDRVGYGKRKIDMMSEAMSSKVAKVLNVSASAVLGHNETIEKGCNDCSDFKSLIQEFKDKCLVSTNCEKVLLLAMAPTSWSIDKVATEFNVTRYIA